MKVYNIVFITCLFVWRTCGVFLIDDAAALVGAGATLAATGATIGTSAGTMTGYIRSITIEVTNYSNEVLKEPKWNLNAGDITNPPNSIAPGDKEEVGAHKASHSAYGTSGTISWKIGDAEEYMIIMWSVPYDQLSYSNWLGLGIKFYPSDVGDFNTMYYYDRAWFDRDYFEKTGSQLIYEGDEYYVMGIMGSSEKPEAEISFVPKYCDNLHENFEDLKGKYCSTGAKSDKGKKIGSGLEVDATALFSVSETGVEGSVVVDENGNVLVDLNVEKLNTDLCEFDGSPASFTYFINKDWKYDADDTQSKYGPEKCDAAMTGEFFDPFNAGYCSGAVDIDYFSCAIGDLSGRFGIVEPNDKGEISVIENISNEEVDGFCGKRLNPEQLYGRSVVFSCNDRKGTPLFCSKFNMNIFDLTN